MEQLARVVPLVHRLGGINALVTLEANQLTTQPTAQNLGDLGLSDAGLALKKERTSKGDSQEDRSGQSPIG